MVPRTRNSKRIRGNAAPSLNLDVLRRVLHYLSVADLKQTAVVSHALHEAAIREILTRGVRFDGPPTQLKAFCRFMLRRDPPLYSFLRSIEIVRIVNRPSDGFDPNILLKVLSRATYLSNLRIHWPEKDSPSLFTPACAKRLAAIIPKLQSLRRLQLGDVPKAAHKILAEVLLNLQSQLRALDVICDRVELNDEFPHDLGSHQTQLRCLRIFYPDLIRTPWVPLPSVRTLTLLWPDSLPMSLRHIVETFPSLRELFICLGRPGKRACVQSLPQNQAGARADALEFQNACGSEPRWQSLDVLSTSTIAEAWMLGLACRVGAVRLGAYDVECHAAFVDVVARVRPTKVIMVLECAERCVHPEVGPRVFLSPSDARHTTNPCGSVGAVTHAVVFLVTSPLPEETRSTAGIVEIVGSHLKHSTLEYLHLIIAANDILGHIDIALLVSGLAGAGKCLGTVALTIAERGQSVWRINRSAGGQMITRITDPGFARAVIAWEEHAYMHR